MHANGRSCFRGSGQKPFPGGVDAFIEQVRKWSGAGLSPIRREGDIVYFDYVQNPAGLKVADGWCLCPLVEKNPGDVRRSDRQARPGGAAGIAEARRQSVPVQDSPDVGATHVGRDGILRGG